MKPLWESIPGHKRSRMIWWLWFATWLLLLAGLFNRTFYAYTVYFSGAHALLFLFLFQFRISPRPVQVRLAYLLWVAVGTYIPYMVFLMYITTVGLAGNLFFGYCPLARLMSLMPWNREESLSLGLLRRTFLSPPSSGPFAPPPSAK